MAEFSQKDQEYTVDYSAAKKVKVSDKSKLTEAISRNSENTDSSIKMDLQNKYNVITPVPKPR